MDYVGIFLLGLLAFLFYMTFYTLYGYKVEKSIITRFKAIMKEIADELGIPFEDKGTKSLKIGKHVAVIEPAPRYNPITTKVMKRKGLLKEYVFFRTRLSAPKGLEILFIPKTQRRLLSKYAGLIAQLQKAHLIEGFVCAANDVKALEKLVRRHKKTFMKVARLRGYIRYLYYEGGELESSFELEELSKKLLRELFSLHLELAEKIEAEFARDFFYRLRGLGAFGPFA